MRSRFVQSVKKYKTHVVFCLSAVMSPLITQCGNPVLEEMRDVIYGKTVETLYPNLPQGQAEALWPFIAKFEEEIGYKVDIPVQIGKVANVHGTAQTKGVCMKRLDINYRGVLIDQTYVEENITHQPAKLEWLIFHELGHCILDRGHTDQQVQVGDRQRKSSIMHTFILSDDEVDFYIHNREYYWQELRE